MLVTAPPPLASSSEQLIPGKDFELRPQGRPADVLRLIPGLIINQHQGGGKAEQYLIRGFDADHGTDLALFVDGIPVNMRSHAHGQGYADLHFLIPETVKLVDVLKGPYWAQYGDFGTAGVVNFVTRDFVEENTLEVAGGSFNTQRYLALLSPTRGALKTFIAADLYRNDGPFDRPNGYLRASLFAKASADIAEDMRLAVSASHYRAEWHGSGQIPARAVRSGLIDRFGSIDPNEGGTTQRTNLNVEYTWKPTENQKLSAHAYVTYYELNLFNNFTLFLNDPELGDAINQRDRRYPGRLQHPARGQVAPLRDPGHHDRGIPVPHRHPADRPRQRGPAPPDQPAQDVSIVEQSYSPFLSFDIVPVEKVRLVTGARGDIFSYQGTEHVNTVEGNLNGSTTRERAEREGQPGPRPLGRDRALRQLRHRLPQQ